MQNPLEKFLLNLAEKIQTEKEYKEIVNNSQSVDVNKNVFEGFIAGVAETIKKELKERAAVFPLSSSPAQPEIKQDEDPFLKFASTLATAISANKNKPVETKPSEENEEKQKQKEKPETVPETSVETPKQDSFEAFMGNLKDILQKNPKQIPDKKKKKIAPENKDKVRDYVSELKKDENEEKIETQEDSIKNLVRRFVEGEIKNFKDELGTKIGQMGSSYGGGGNNSYNYYPGGGPMLGNLQFPISGTGILFYDGTLLTSASGIAGGGGGGGDPAVNTVVYNNSANWNSTYTTLSTNSANWNSNYTTTNSNSGKWDSSYLNQNALSSRWDSSYTTVNSNSASWTGLRSIQTSNFNALEGNYYIVNTTSAPLTGFLPQSPSSGTTITFQDSFIQWQTNDFTLNRSGSMIQGLNEDMICDRGGIMFSVSYIGGSVGWRVN